MPLKARILCTEDDVDTRDILCAILEMHGFEVICAKDSTQAIDLATATKFDLYLLDNWLPGMTGDDLCRKLRGIDPITPVLFYSGAAYDSDKARALAAGAQGYVVKPADPEDLVREISRLIPSKE
ncbi:MAG: hypothetical protein QOH71_2892 [Blastocatellia bacterium]|jgi:DNA-binding response OmpR family regulator|nr:hypothetical protein [Blastocatellia bacterium]